MYVALTNMPDVDFFSRSSFFFLGARLFRFIPV